jgi:hypothetical protein
VEPEEARAVEERLEVPERDVSDLLVYARHKRSDGAVGEVQDLGRARLTVAGDYKCNVQATPFVVSLMTDVLYLTFVGPGELEGAQATAALVVVHVLDLLDDDRDALLQRVQDVLVRIRITEKETQKLN